MRSARTKHLGPRDHLHIRFRFGEKPKHLYLSGGHTVLVDVDALRTFGRRHNLRRNSERSKNKWGGSEEDSETAGVVILIGAQELPTAYVARGGV